MFLPLCFVLNRKTAQHPNVYPKGIFNDNNTLWYPLELVGYVIRGKITQESRVKRRSHTRAKEANTEQELSPGKKIIMVEIQHCKCF